MDLLLKVKESDLRESLVSCHLRLLGLHLHPVEIWQALLVHTRLLLRLRKNIGDNVVEKLALNRQGHVDDLLWLVLNSEFLSACRLLLTVLRKIIHIDSPMGSSKSCI